jgi:hypothetical protein
MLNFVIIISLAISSFSFLNNLFSKAEKWLDTVKTVNAELLIVETSVPDYFSGKVTEEFNCKNLRQKMPE